MTTRSLPLLYPTKIFAGLLFVLGTMWYGGASQNNAANFLLFFTTIALFLVSIPHTFLNLTRLHASAESIRPAFAGQEVAVPVEIVNRSRATRYGVQLSVAGATPELIDEIPATQAARVTVRFPAETRGEYEIAELRLTSTYPLGFLGTSRRVPAARRYLVYPRPAGDLRLPAGSTPRRGAQAQSHTGEGDDYAGVRAYVPGESQRQIDWKAVARGQPLMTKQFTAETDDVVQLDYSAIAAATPEQRLSQLALWVIEAERARRRYALRLPATSIPAASGEEHYHRCLRALALHA